MSVPDITDFALEHTCDPECDPDPYLPTPYMNLPRAIETIEEILDKLHPPQAIRDRLVRWVELANEMLGKANA